MSEFIPPGYSSVSHVVMCVLRHLNADKTAEDLEKITGPDAQSKALEAVHFLRGLLFEKKLEAYYSQPIFGGMAGIGSDFWLGDDADGTIVSGRYWPFGPNRSYRDDKPNGALYFKAGAIELALRPELTSEPAPSRAGGRPKKSDAALAAYDALYPRGHRAVGDAWKDVERRVSEHMGESVSADTIQRALNSG